MPTALPKELSDLLTKATTLAADGLSWSDFGKLWEAIKIAAVAEASKLIASGYTKKDFVMATLKTFLDTVTLPLPWYMAWAAPMVKAWLLSVADGAIEALYAQLKDRSLQAITV